MYSTALFDYIINRRVYNHDLPIIEFVQRILQEQRSEQFQGVVGFGRELLYFCIMIGSHLQYCFLNYLLHGANPCARCELNAT